jgi:hypothetical protein
LNIQGDDSVLKRAVQEAISKAAQAQERELIERVTREGVFARMMEAQDRMIMHGTNGTLYIDTTGSSTDAANGLTYGGMTNTYADTSNGWKTGVANLVEPPSLTAILIAVNDPEWPLDRYVFAQRTSRGITITQNVDQYSLRALAEAAEAVLRIDPVDVVCWRWRDEYFNLSDGMTAKQLLGIYAKEEQNMALTITISLQSVRDFDPVAAGLEEVRAALAVAALFREGYKLSEQECPDWLLDKTRKIKRALVDRQRDADAAELARLKARKAEKEREAQTLNDLDAQIAKLDAKLKAAETA